MTTPVAPIGVPDVFTGLGTFVERHGRTIYFGHDGRNPGFLSISRATLGGEGAVVMTNGEAGAPLLFEILRSIAVEYAWDGWLPPPIRAARLESSQLAALAGRYGAGSDGSITIVARGDRLEAREPFREPLELVPIDAGTFVSRADGARFTFRRGGAELERKPNGEPARVMARVAAGAVEPLRLLEDGRFDEALAQYRALRAARPEDPAIAESRFDELASALLDERLDYERAIRVFRVEAALYPGSANANAGLALAYLRAGRRAEAAPFLDRALALHGHDRPRAEMEELYLGVRITRMKQLAAP